MPRQNPDMIEVSVATEATDELARAFARLIPQLSISPPPDRQALAEIIASPSNTILLARDRSNGGEIVGTETLGAARERHLESRDELPLPASRLQKGEPAIPTRHT